MQDNVLFEAGAGETIRRRLHLQDFIDYYLLGKPWEERIETKHFKCSTTTT